MWVKTGCWAGLRIRVELVRIWIRPSRKNPGPVVIEKKSNLDPTLEKQPGFGSDLPYKVNIYLIYYRDRSRQSCGSGMSWPGPESDFQEKTDLHPTVKKNPDPDITLKKNPDPEITLENHPDPDPQLCCLARLEELYQFISVGFSFPSKTTKPKGGKQPNRPQENGLTVLRLKSAL